MEQIFLDIGPSTTSTSASATPISGALGVASSTALPSTSSVNTPASQVNVHPVVLFSILDQYVRREAVGDKVIGALLGTVNGNVVEVTNSFGIYHKTTQDEILIKRQTLYDMLELHRRVDPKETLVGWYSTWVDGASSRTAGSALAVQQGSGDRGGTPHIDQFSLVVQDFFAEAAQGKTPLHMLVDVSLATPHIRVFAYQPVRNNITKNVIAQFARLRLQVVASTEERVALDTMVRSARLNNSSSASGSSLSQHASHVPLTGEARDMAPDLEGLEASLRRLKGLLDVVGNYVEDVLSGKKEGDEALGRQIADALSCVPSLTPDRLRGGLDSAIKDVLMVTYLSQLASVHLKIAERIAQLPNF